MNDVLSYILTSVLAAALTLFVMGPSTFLWGYKEGRMDMREDFRRLGLVVRRRHDR
jgi:hypothetical protein